MYNNNIILYKWGDAIMKTLQNYERFLREQEKADNTIVKYLNEAGKMIQWLSGRKICKGALLAYKQHLKESHSPVGVNAAISSINNFLEFCNLSEMKLKTLKVQRRAFRQSERELTKGEYDRLLQAAKSSENLRLYHIMQTICATGIRVSELRYITVEAVEQGRTEIRLKGKIRTILLPRELCRLLSRYISKNGIKCGSVFITQGGKAVDRSNIWREMKIIV